MTEAAPSPIIDTDRAWAKNHIDEYLATDGKKPDFKYGAPVVLLTTQGRKSGDSWSHRWVARRSIRSGI
jgi:hypothetical protein